MRPPCDRNPEKSAAMIAPRSRIMEADEAAGPGRKRQQFSMQRDFGEGQGSAAEPRDEGSANSTTLVPLLAVK